MLNRLYTALVLGMLACIAFFSPVFAQSAPRTLELFWANGCPHCEKEQVFLEKLSKKYPELTIQKYEITTSSENTALLRQRGRELGADVSGVPFTVVGNRFAVGFATEQTTGKRIEEMVQAELGVTAPEPSSHEKNTAVAQSIQVPLFGQIQIKDLSLPVLTVVIAFLDGFNPCAMWTLLFLISLLLGMQDKKRMWLLGMAFISASGLVYFLFLSAWLNAFMFIGMVPWVRAVIGLVALVAGGMYLKEYYEHQTGCKVTGNEKRKQVFERLRQIVANKSLILALIGIVLLAFAVNLVELVCSAGLPAIYTQVLSLSNLPMWQYYLYLLVYVLIFMADDLFIFFTAMATLRATGLQTKYTHLSRLIGGILMALIGLLLLFRPDLLMFG